MVFVKKVFSFTRGNPMGFHDAQGKGFNFITDKVIELDSINPQSAAPLVRAFCYWKKYDRKRRSLMKAELQRH